MGNLDETVGFLDAFWHEFLLFLLLFHTGLDFAARYGLDIPERNRSSSDCQVSLCLEREISASVNVVRTLGRTFSSCSPSRDILKSCPQYMWENLENLSNISPSNRSGWNWRASMPPSRIRVDFAARDLRQGNSICT